VNRIYHHWEAWECFKAGFYNSEPPAGITPDMARELYGEFLSDVPRFEAALSRVITEWRNSCEQFLSNESMNRIAWLGQASMCISTGVPSVFRGGFKQMSIADQRTANAIAGKWLDKWLKRQGDESENTGIHNNMAQAGLFGRDTGRSA